MTRGTQAGLGLADLELHVMIVAQSRLGEPGRLVAGERDYVIEHGAGDAQADTGKARGKQAVQRKLEQRTG